VPEDEEMVGIMMRLRPLGGPFRGTVTAKAEAEDKDEQTCNTHKSSMASTRS
jgi:hypothetical protein